MGAGGSGVMDDGRRFWAFLSYSHEDREWASWLHRALETYSVPTRLVGRQSPAGPVPRRLRPIFKDREDLAANAGLRQHVWAALDASSALIVICSPTAAASGWVQEEIVRFKTLRGEARVFAVIVAGSPGASRTAGREAEECFPPALRFKVDSAGALTEERAELIAADLRPHGDGRKLAKLKLIAGILGLDLDELVRRDAHRRTQQLTALTAASLAGAVAMGGLALAALTSRNEARAQRAQAEGLVEFMLGDLSTKLAPTGRLDLLDAVGARVLGYYKAQAGHRLDAPALAQRATVLQLLGQIQDKRGKLDAALDDFQRAFETTKQLLRQKPKDGQAVFNHAQSVYWIGNIAYERGERGKALSKFLEYKGLTERLISIDPTRNDWQAEAADASSNLGTFYLGDYRLPEARKAFARTLALSQALAIKAPSDRARQMDLAQAYAWMADAEKLNDDYDVALKNRLAEREIYEQLLGRHADDNEVIQALVVNKTKIGLLLLSHHNVSNAISELIDAHREANRLFELDHENVWYMQRAASADVALGQAYLNQRSFEPAATMARRARELAEAMVRKDPTVEEWQGMQLGGARVLQIKIDASASHDDRTCAAALEPAVEESRRLMRLSAARSRDLALAEIAANAAILGGDYSMLMRQNKQARNSWDEAVRALHRVNPDQSIHLDIDGEGLLAAALRRIMRPSWRNPHPNLRACAESIDS
jgi:tetratricopeptide (TPR) repeat protein